jgi:hypothetical protein
VNIDARPPNEAGDVANRGPIRPPLLYLTSLIVGGLVQLAVPLPFLARSLAAPIGMFLVVVAIALFWFSVVNFRTAGTPVPGDKPSTMIVRTGPYRFSRNQYILRSQCFSSVSPSVPTACGCWPHLLERWHSSTMLSYLEKSSTWSGNSVRSIWTIRRPCDAGCKLPN